MKCGTCGQDQAAERERDKLLHDLGDEVARASALDAQLARLREPLTDEECGPLWRACSDGMRAVIAKFFELRQVPR